MKFRLITLFIIIGSILTTDASSQNNTLRFDYHPISQMDYDAMQFLSSNAKNKLIWFDGWHEGAELNESKLLYQKKQLALIPNSRSISNKRSSRSYYKNLRELNKKLNKKTKSELLTWPGCAGPKSKKLSDKVKLIYIDTEWFFQEDSRSEYSTTKCETLWEADFWATLEDIVEDEEDRLICIVGHHTITSEQGNVPSASFLHPHNGPKHDYNSHAYTQLRMKMDHILNSYKHVIYLSPNQTKNKIENRSSEIFLYNYDYINFVNTRAGDVTIEGIKNGKSQVIKTYHFPSKEQIQQGIKVETKGAVMDTTIITGEEYRASKWKAFWLGKNYRNEWTASVTLPKLHTDDISGGLTPYAKGGGLQTHSLKFKDKLGRKFAFRSVNKDAKKNKGRAIMNSAVGEVKQDMISSQLPFGDVVVGHLLDNTDILHVTPRAFVLADQASLGKYRDDFANIVGTLEEKPTKKTKKRAGFEGADDIISTHEVFRRVLKSSKHQIDKLAFAKCIMFDLWIADWDRHHDNWKWAEYDKDEMHIYLPFPRDRDHAFALFEGVIGNISDIAAPNVAELSSSIKDIKGMTFQGKNMLYFLGSSITLEEWNTAAKYIDLTFTDEVIDKAWSKLPVAIQSYSKEKIISALESRKKDLEKASNQLYELYHKRAIFYGTNKDDKIIIDVDSDKQLTLSLFKSRDSNSPLVSKTYDPTVTKVLEIFTLDGKDAIEITGSTDSGIEVILVPGTDKDQITPKNSSQNITIYDTQKYGNLQTHELESPIYPDLYAFQYDALLPFAMYKYDSDYGSGLEIAATKINQGFNKKPFTNRTKIAAKWYPRGEALRLKLDRQVTDVWGEWDSRFYIRAAHNDTRYDRFTGVNNPLPTDYLRNYYRTEDYYVQNNNIDARFGAMKQVFGLSELSFGVGSHYLQINEGTGTSAKELGLDSDIWKLYINGAINLNFTDHLNYPTKGVKYNLESNIGYNLKSNTGFYSNLSADITWVNSWRDISRSIFLLKLGAETVQGNRTFIDYPILGNGNNVRGFANNLIRSSNVAYLNAELRKEIWKSDNKILPFLMGVSLFYDAGLSNISKNNLAGYGGGIYLTFLNNAFAVYINNSYNTLNDNSIIHYGIGFTI